jgi:hypothetical protein
VWGSCFFHLLKLPVVLLRGVHTCCMLLYTTVSFTKSRLTLLRRNTSAWWDGNQYQPFECFKSRLDGEYKCCSFQAVPHCMHTLGLANTFLGASGSFLFGKPAPVEYLRRRLTKLTRVGGAHTQRWVLVTNVVRSKPYLTVCTR